MSRRFSYFLIYDVQLFYLLLFSREFYCFLTCQFSFCVLYGRGCAAFLQRHKLHGYRRGPVCSRLSASRSHWPSPSGDSAPPLGDCKLALNKVLLPTFPHRKVAPRRVGMLTKPCKRPRPAARRLQTIPKINLYSL